MKRTIFFINLLLIFILLITTVSAQIEVEKKTKESNLEVGKIVTIILEIKNTHEDTINIQIIDENLFGNNGIKVSCLEASITSNSVQEIELDSITLYKAGEFELPKAQVKYTLNNKEQLSESNTLTVSVEGKDSTQNIAEVTEIYQCGGVSSRSKSVSMGGGSSFSFSSQGSPGNSITKILGGNPSTPKVENTNIQLLQSIRQDEQYQEIEKELNADGYILQDYESNEKEFAFLFKNGNKKKLVTGKLEDGLVSSIKINTTAKWFKLILITSLLLMVIVSFFIFIQSKYEPLPKEFESNTTIPKPKRIIHHVTLPKDSIETFIEISKITKESAKQKSKTTAATTNQILSELKNKKINIKTYQELFQLCDKAIYSKSYTKEELQRAKELFNKIK